MRSTKTLTRFLAVFMALTMLLSCSVLAVDTTETPASPESLFISQSEAADKSVTFTLDAETFAAVNGKSVTWTLTRTASYANPAEGVMIPLLGESEMYPNEMDTIDLATMECSNPKAKDQTFKTTKLETTFDEAASTMTLSFSIQPLTSDGQVGAPHINGGNYLDYCGVFTLSATADGKAVNLGKEVEVTIKPYESFHTMWEIYAEMDRLAGLGDDNDRTATPYVVKESMGKSNLGYDMPYLIVAKDSDAVANWLDLCQRAETDPEGVLADIKADKLNYQVPVLYTNIHANEVASSDGILEFAKMLIEDEEMSYKKLTALTEAGQAKLDEQRAAMGLHTPELVADKTSFLGGILPETSLSAEGGKFQYSGVVENFDDYYTSETATVNVDELLDDVFFILVPEENVEGRMYITRYSSGGYDLNRDNSFQTQIETQNMQKLIGTYNPVTLLELHGQVETFQVEPCSPPHEPNVEYDLLSNYLMPGGEAFGAAAIANNPEYQSYAVPMRDYLYSDAEGNPDWTYPWDDMSTSYTPQFAMLQGCVGYTVELPAYCESTRMAATYGLMGLSDFVAENKDGYFANQVAIYERCLNNENTDAEVGPWLVDAADVEGAEADLFRPAYDGPAQNGQFFPEAYIIPLDGENQPNLQAAYDMVEWLTRNDVLVSITDEAFTYDEVGYPAGTAIVSMYQAKRAVANGVLYDGTVIRNWTDLYSEGITAFDHTRGFAMVTVAEPAAYELIAGFLGETLDYDAALTWLAENAKSQFFGETAADVILCNTSEDAVAAVNALLKAGKTVGMVTEGDYEGHFICSYADYETVKDAYVLTAIGVEGSVTASVIEKAPTVYISGTAAALTPADMGYVNTNRITPQPYNYDRMAMEIMNFTTTSDASKADAVIGATALDASGLAAVQAGATYIGYTKSAASTVNEKLVAVGIGSTSGMDCLGTVTYPEKTLTNATYINEGDSILYGYGTAYFTSLPVGAKILVQGDGEYPMEGFLNGDETSLSAFLSGVKGFSYQGKDMDGNDVNITLFANTLTNKAHQRDEYAYISNTIFANLLTDQPYGGGFVDVAAGAYYAEAVDWAVENGITTGTSDTTFSPNNACTRAQTVTFLWRAAGQPAPTTTENPFTDVKEGAYYYDAVLWAVENGITNGTSETTFGPDNTVNRAQTVTFLHRAAGAPAVEGENPFTDVKADAYYAAATTWAVANGITNGTTETTFAPSNPCTRGQIVTMLYRDAQVDEAPETPATEESAT